ncbi:MAG TPA: Asp-tRNA(Asn)/Glu-tRNA(Gln) amidotransferase subunit GatA [Polyangiales bacterium]|nr:Asp-tRNA(Asn)/Glu-tRNA(Gln) amidotransferase subunit GatA [Polyangiales bacterium]
MGAFPWQSAFQIREQVASGAVSAVEVARAYLNRAETLNPTLRCFLTLDYEGALAAAAQVDRARRAGEALGSLAGVPIALKDNLCTRGVPTTCASKILEGYIPPYDAHVVEALRAAGAIILGKTNLDEFAMGSSNENSAFGNVHNPWDLARAPGGSSGGSACATAAGLTALALGSDTGGSVRQPAAFCGITAIKPTYGRVSRYGLVAFASSLDQVGPMARSVREAAQLLEVVAGHDPRDATSAERETGAYLAACDRDVRGLRIGVVRDLLEGLQDTDVRSSVQAALGALENAGAELVDVSLPHADHAVSVYYLIATAEASSNLARFDGIRYGLRVEGEDLAETYTKTRAQGFGPEVRRRIMLGTYALSAGYYDAFYLKAQRVRTLIRRDYDAAFERCDVVCTPTTPTPAFALGEKTSDPLEMYLADIFTLPPSLAGVAALSTPCGLSGDGLPIGLQLVAPPFEEELLCTVAQAVEDTSGLRDARPRAVA